MSSFKKLNTKIYSRDKPEITPDVIYWKQLNSSAVVKEFGPIDSIDFSPVDPFYYAVTCSVRVQLYNPMTNLVVKNLSRFREKAYGAVFRSDGRLLCSGCEETHVKLFDVASKNLLRLFKGHTAAVHRTYFLEDKPQIASFSDDKTVKLWDIPTETNLVTYSDHTDYIRAGATNCVIPNLLLSGSYDNSVKMYDTRCNAVVLSVSHGKPVESLIFLKSGSVFLSAGGTEIKMWDTVAGGKLLGNISQHHKTITCMKLASDNKRLLSGSLDRSVKVYDLSNFNVVHSFKFTNAVTSLAVSKSDKNLAVGLVDGLVVVNSRTEASKDAKDGKKITHQHTTKLHEPVNDLVVSKTELTKEAKYDKCLRKFEYSKALDLVLMPYVSNKQPEVTVSVIQELIKRRALEKALVGKEAKGLVQLLKFFKRNITEARFTKVLINAVNVVVDMSRTIAVDDAEVKELLVDLVGLLKEEQKVADEMFKLQGAINMILSAAAIQSSGEESKRHNLLPSENAEKAFVISIS